MRDGLTVEDWELLWDAAKKNKWDPSAACKELYAQYVRSDLWKDNRQPALNRAHGRCEECKRAPVFQVHHKHYDNLFRERLEDLIALCGPCHARKHGIILPAAAQPRRAVRATAQLDWFPEWQREFWRVGEAA